MKMAQDILSLLRDPFKLKEVEKRYPFTYEDSMNSVLLQEMARFNTLLAVITGSIHTLIRTLEGKLVMNPDIERMLNAFKSNAVPESWRARSYPSKKPLMSYVRDLKDRLQMLEDWY